MRFVGVHYAITAEQRDGLLGQPDDAAKMEYFGGIEEAFDEEHGQICDNAWEAIHCCLTDSPSPDPKAGSAPENLAILGGQQVLGSEKEHIIRLVEADQARALAEVLKTKDKAWMQEMFAKHSPDDGQDVIDATWDWFEKVRDFYARAARNGRAVLFTADQ
jgi:hypothetical protein